MIPVSMRTAVVAGLLVLVSSAVEAQSGSFDVVLRGKPVGTASFRMVPAAGGFASEASARVSTEGVEYAFSKTEKLSAQRGFESAELNAVVNGSAVHLMATAEGAEIALKVSADGRVTTAKLGAHPAGVLLPDFDPGGLQTLVTLAAGRNGRDLWLVIPRQAGMVAPVQVATYADEKGTLGGKPIVVHHLTATCDGASTDLFTGAENQLLQAELPQAGFALVRKGFVLTPAAKAPAPPADPAPVQ